MSTTQPSWSAAENGMPGNLDAVNQAAQLNQFLNTHQFEVIYEGINVVTPSGGDTFEWSVSGVENVSQRFIMSGTSMGRVSLPLQVVGSGSDVIVKLCPDNGSGSPDTSNVIASTVLPAKWLTQLSAVNGLENAGPLGMALFNTLYPTGGAGFNPFSSPTSTGSANVLLASFISSGNYLISAGGLQPVGQFSRIVSTMNYLGDGVLEAPVLQPLLPVGNVNGSLAATATTVIYAGGAVGVGAANIVGTVLTASWDPNNGVIGTWSAQTSLPSPQTFSATATWNDTVYLIGGFDSTDTITANVMCASCVNGVINSWVTLPPYPMEIFSPAVGVIGDKLIVVGGYDSGSLPTNLVYFADILSDGTITQWRRGPDLVVPQAAGSSVGVGWSTVVTPNAVVAFTGDDGGSDNPIQVITADSHGLTHQVARTAWSNASQLPFGTFLNGSVEGAYDVIGVDTSANVAYVTTLTPVPMISVPLYTLGLTNGVAYHVVLAQKSVDPNNYVRVGTTNAAFTDDALTASGQNGPWTTLRAGCSIPVSIYDTSFITGTNAFPWHTREDPSVTGSGYTSNAASRASLLTYEQEGQLLGLIESVTLPNNPLNVNPTFTSGVSSWTATNGTFTQSNAQVHGGFSFSGLLTPTGGFSSAFVTSELVDIRSSAVPAQLGRRVMVNGWFYSSTGTSNFSLSVSWHDNSSTLISTTSNVITLAAATWTNVVNYFAAPITAAFATLVPTESGTPTSSNLIYMSDVVLTYSPETVASVTTTVTIDYDPDTGLPVTVTELS